jgi:hypothetical protein
MFQRFIQVALLSGATAMVGWAADVTGKWSGEINGPNGGMTLNANFKQDGAKLTGTMDGPGGPMQIEDGKVEGEKIVFAVSFNGMKIVHEGSIKGETISLQIKFDGGGPGGDGPGPINLKRAK